MNHLPPPDPEDKLRTIAETAKRLRLSERQVHRLIRSGALAAFKIGRLWRITDRAIDALLEKSRYHPKGGGGRC